MSPNDGGASRPHPVADELTAPFWEAARAGTLSIQRCQECRRYHFPPVEACVACNSVALEYEPVSGRGKVHSYTQTGVGARHSYWAGRSPYLVGLVELEEQPGLLLYTNFPGAELEDLEVGQPVELCFELLESGQPLPQFALAGVRSASPESE